MAARPHALPDDDDDLLPGPVTPRGEAEDTDAQAVSRLEAATGATSEGTKPAKAKAEKVERPRPIRAKRPSLPKLPTNLDEPVMTFPVRCKLVSLGRSVKNVTATLNFDVPIPQDFRDVLGEHAYTVGFLNGWLGDGVTIKKVPLSADAENRQVQTMQVQIPRFLNESTDQLVMGVTQLIGGKRFVEELFALEWPWRLNIPVDIEGEVSLYAMQQSFDLTKRAEDTVPDGEMTVEIE